MDLDVYFRFLLALLLVLALIAGLTWAARRFGFGGLLAPKTGKSSRLSIAEIKVVDSRRKLILVRRDACEHLVLLGPSQDLLLETRISAPSKGPCGPAATKNAPGAPEPGTS